MPNSRARKKRLAEKQRKESKQVNVERRMSTCSMNPAMLQGCKDGGGRRRMSMGCSTRIRSDSSSSDGADSCPEGEMDGPNSGLFTSAVSWFSYGLDYVIPSRKLVRELEETKERLKAAEDQLKKEKKKARRSVSQGVSFAVSPSRSSSPMTQVPPAPAPPPPPPPPMATLLPKPLVIKRGKKSADALSKSQDSSRPLVTIDDLMKIKLKPAVRMVTRSQSKKADPSGPLVSLQQLKSVRLKRANTVDVKTLRESTNGITGGRAPSSFAKRLRRLDIRRSPGGTPVSLAAEHCAAKENVDMTPMLSIALQRRFGSAMLHSPLSSPDRSDSSFLSQEGDR